MYNLILCLTLKQTNCCSFCLILIKKFSKFLKFLNIPQYLCMFRLAKSKFLWWRHVFIKTIIIFLDIVHCCKISQIQFPSSEKFFSYHFLQRQIYKILQCRTMSKNTIITFNSSVILYINIAVNASLQRLSQSFINSRTHLSYCVVLWQ